MPPKPKIKKLAPEPAGLDIQVKMDKPNDGTNRIVVTVTILKDGIEIATASDSVQV